MCVRELFVNKMISITIIAKNKHMLAARSMPKMFEYIHIRFVFILPII